MAGDLPSLQADPRRRGSARGVRRHGAGPDGLGLGGRHGLAWWQWLRWGVRLCCEAESEATPSNEVVSRGESGGSELDWRPPRNGTAVKHGTTSTTIWLAVSGGLS
ncbi:hypothetical protein ZWY2020_055343 [Hordeum vulgare]|nr:hypothetical protein ZWY2020_055343 [Hordeum vulgare]